MPDKNVVHRFLDEDVSDIYTVARQHVWLADRFSLSSIDTSRWVVSLGGSSTAYSGQRTDDSPVYLLLDALSGVISRKAQIYSGKIFNMVASTFTTQKQFFTTVTASWFACLLDTITNYVDLGTTMGFTDTTGGPGVNDIAMFAKVLGVLYARTDEAGTDEDTDVSSGITLTNWNKYAIEVTSASVKFYINNSLKATHATRKPQLPCVLNFMSIAEAGTKHARLCIAYPRVVYEVASEVV